MRREGVERKIKSEDGSFSDPDAKATLFFYALCAGGRRSEETQKKAKIELKNMHTRALKNSSSFLETRTSELIMTDAARCKQPP